MTTRGGAGTERSRRWLTAVVMIPARGPRHLAPTGEAVAWMEFPWESRASITAVGLERGHGKFSRARLRSYCRA
jgi:hypothetical protein